MNKVLVKYIDGNSISEKDYIKVIYTDTPFELLRVVKQVDHIKIDGEHYQYESSKYKVPESMDYLDVLIIYVDPMDI